MNDRYDRNDELALIQRYFAGELDADAEHAFWDAVAADEAFARRVTAYSMLESQLIERTGGIAPRAQTAAPERAAFVFPRAGLAAAAAVLIAAAIVAVYVFVVAADDPAAEPVGEPIATLIRASGAVVVDGTMAYGGRQYPAGTIAMDGGSAEFQLSSGTSVRLRGQSRLAMIDGMNASMSRGVATFRCPPRAVGYTVHLPGGARVVDLGTAFTVWVDARGRSYIYLHEGSVALHPIEGAPQTLTGRGAWSADTDGRDAGAIDPAEAPDIVAFDPEWIEPAGVDYAAAVLEDDPMMYWRFDRAFKGRVLDHTGNGHDARLVESASLDAGLLDRAMRPNTPEAFGEAMCQDVLHLMVTDTYTIECWARANRVHNGAIFSLGDAVLLEFQPARTRGQVEPTLRYLHRPVGPSDGGENLYHPYEAGRWYHIVAVKTRDTMTLYIDGAPVATAEIADPLFETAPTFSLGRLSTKPLGNAQSRPLRGAIDEVAIYRTALSAERIKQHYEAANVAAEEFEKRSGEQPPTGESP